VRKCESCIWADKKSGVKIVCPFVRCVITQGFKVDEELKKKARQNT